ncbi:hypothetical protein BaRGS_00022948 [Batillaria attramentaria]|uniref:Uncharacterized protein n=1 Tax=Batillaria attramentaria TaxID=370345 RepID=A0ABD0KFU6_9CAEN
MSTSKVILPAASSYSSFSRHSSHANQNGACGHVSLIGSQEELKMSPCDSPGACFQANQNGTCDHVPLTDMQEEVEVSACDGPDAYFQTNQNGACGHVPLIDTQCEKESNCESVDSSDSSSEDSGDHVPLIDTQDEKESTYEKYTSCRWTLTYLGFLMNMLVYCVRNSMSMTLLCMDDVKKGQRLVTGLDSNITMLPVGYKGNGSFLEDEDNSLNSTILSVRTL